MIHETKSSVYGSSIPKLTAANIDSASQPEPL